MVGVWLINNPPSFFFFFFFFEGGGGREMWVHGWVQLKGLIVTNMSVCIVYTCQN